jgi:hypothetical protein
MRYPLRYWRICLYCSTIIAGFGGKVKGEFWGTEKIPKNHLKISQIVKNLPGTLALGRGSW